MADVPPSSFLVRALFTSVSEGIRLSHVGDTAVLVCDHGRLLELEVQHSASSATMQLVALAWEEETFSLNVNGVCYSRGPVPLAVGDMLSLCQPGAWEDSQRFEVTSGEDCVDNLSSRDENTQKAGSVAVAETGVAVVGPSFFEYEIDAKEEEELTARYGRAMEYAKWMNYYVQRYCPFAAGTDGDLNDNDEDVTARWILLDDGTKADMRGECTGVHRLAFVTHVTDAALTPAPSTAVPSEGVTEDNLCGGRCCACPLLTRRCRRRPLPHSQEANQATATLGQSVETNTPAQGGKSKGDTQGKQQKKGGTATSDVVKREEKGDDGDVVAAASSSPWEAFLSAREKVLGKGTPLLSTCATSLTTTAADRSAEVTRLLDRIQRLESLLSGASVV